MLTPDQINVLNLDALKDEVVKLRAALYRIATYRYSPRATAQEKQLDAEQLAHDALDASLVRIPDLNTDV